MKRSSLTGVMKTFFRVGAASHVVPNDIFVRRCNPDSRAIHWDTSHFIAVELSSYLFGGMNFSKITRSKEKKNGALMSRVLKVDVPRRHVRGDKLVVVFQLAGMFLCSGLHDDVCISKV
nr:hypothetical protein [Tanacetum cinerariifolium]